MGLTIFNNSSWNNNVQSAINVFGSTVIASYTAASKVLQLVMQPSISFGVTIATYAGQNLGAKDLIV